MFNLSEIELSIFRKLNFGLDAGAGEAGAGIADLITEAVAAENATITVAEVTPSLELS